MPAASPSLKAYARAALIPRTTSASRMLRDQSFEPLIGAMNRMMHFIEDVTQSAKTDT